MQPVRFRRLMVANRGEIAIRIFRAAHELKMRTIAVYSHEDRFALHRFKADEAYLIGETGEPIRAYLNIPNLVSTAVAHGVDAIHPGYGFLSENAELARACQRANIAFVGPRADILELLGDKVSARRLAASAGVPILAGSEAPLRDGDDALAQAERLGYPVILKAAHGGGGRGMRVVRTAADMVSSFETARRESLQAFGKDEVFLEKLVERARHLEVQLLGDKHGNLVHLHERDCSIQRRHQKVCEIAPAPTLNEAQRAELCDAALAIGRAAGIDNASTVEFLFDEATGKFFFIEVNPRIQVEHTVTEAVTGVDIVRRQLLIAGGARLDDDAVGLGDQSAIKVRGYAIQCRVTTEDPANDFIPDYGKILHYRSAGGMGIRLDAGNAFSGALVTPFFDSLLVKVTAWGHRFATAAARMERALQEFRIRGVKTNIPFLLNLVTDRSFLDCQFTTRFMDERRELFVFRARRDRATKLLTYLADVTVNGNPHVGGRTPAARRAPAPVPACDVATPPPSGSRQLLQRLGPEKFAQWIKEQPALLMTDTTMRDAHQSLLATRMRTHDMLRIADYYARKAAGLFSLEMWGGATFDASMRFLGESPWLRLAQLRERIPNICFQMLLRASNAVGYTTYPDNVVRGFIHESAKAGIDIFRIFDSLNWTVNMRPAMDAVRETNAICEAAICYTGDILDPRRDKYSLKYYLDLARELEKAGAHMLAIKDMSGLCKPLAAARLVSELKQTIGIPIHFHTHDTAGVQSAAILDAAAAGLDIADAAIAPFSGLTSQPNLNSLVETLRFTNRATGLDLDALNRIADYWERVRMFYAPFETDMRASTAAIYQAEIPGGQYTNLQQQARSLGLGDRFHEVCEVYARVNGLFGDIVKVTPTSKVVGDMAIFMVTNGLTPADVLDPTRNLAFPESVVDMFRGMLGQPPGGWPKALQAKILRGEPPVLGRPGEAMPPADLDAARRKVETLVEGKPTQTDVLTHILYPKVFADFVAFEKKYSDVSVLPTPLFFHGLASNEEVSIEIEPGKTLIVKLTGVSEPNEDGTRTVFFELNGQPREVAVLDRSLGVQERAHPPADPSNPTHIGAPMPGLLNAVAVAVGDKVAKGQKLISIEAMKMETTMYADRDGVIEQVLARPGMQIMAGDLLIVMT